MSYTDPQIGTLTITGDPARFVATERVPVSGVSMDFEPVQDLHGYEYPWPPGGGKNLWNTQAYSGIGYNLAEGTPITLSESTCTVNGNKITYYVESWKGRTFVARPLTTGTYHLQVDISQISNPRISIYIVNNDVILTRIGNYTSGTAISPNINVSDGEYIAIFIGSNTAQTITFLNYQIESGNTASAWSPYSNICPITGRDSVNVYVSPEPAVVDGTEEHEIEFGQTVYAGTLTVNEDGSGQIISKMVAVDLEALTWSKRVTGSTKDGFSASLPNPYIPKQVATPPPCFIAEQYKVVGSTNADELINNIESFEIGVYGFLTTTPTATTFYCVTQSGTTPEGMLVYKLAEPLTLQLDLIEITTLIGLNYVWTSDNNLITITFPYNKEVQPMALNYDHCWTYPKAYIDKLEARIAALETAAAAAAAEANTAAAPANTRETVAEEITVTEEPETEEPVTKKGGK